MDLKDLDIVGLANEGNILHLTHPTTGEVLADNDTEGYSEAVEAIETDTSLEEHEKVAALAALAPPKKWFLRLLGSDSDVYRNAMKRRFERNHGTKKSKLDLDDAQRKGAELLAKCTVECYMTENGKPVQCTRSELVRVYLKYPFIREQAEEFMGDRSNLMKS